ncbi:MAG: hypothetical protein JHC84_14855 [Solirubrobacteraceae bacterium]|nr:hypothetical protein [Solirubrobacteraceae bacterium]
MTVRRLALLLCAALTLACIVPAAHAQSGSGPLLSPPAPEADTAPPPDEEDEDDGLSAVQQLLILGAAIGLLGGIAFVIMRDARRNAPADRRPQQTDEEAGGPAKARQRARDRDKRRAKGKQARQQRKRNR